MTVGHLHLQGDPSSWPGQLLDLYRRTTTGDRFRITAPSIAGSGIAGSDDASGRSGRQPALTELVTGGGFRCVSASRPPSSKHDGEYSASVIAERQWTLPDTVAANMRLLVCGLNPSPTSADRGIGFGRPGNRFWPAAVAAGLVTEAFSPDAALTQHGVGMTDLVKRTTTKASELLPTEYQQGLTRVEQLIAWLQPERICFVGLAGWRVTMDRSAKAGWQNERLGGRPVYLMPSTSGLNAHSQLPDLTEHLSAALNNPVPLR